MITFTCPGCQATFKLPDELAGKPARCSKCDQRFTVPAAVASAAGSAAIATTKAALKPAQETLAAQANNGRAAKPFDDVEVVEVVDKVEVVEERISSADPPRRRIPASIARDDDYDGPRRRRRRRSGSSTGIIIGSIVGGVVFVAVLVVVIILLANRSSRVANEVAVVPVKLDPAPAPNPPDIPGVAPLQPNPAPAANNPGVVLDRQDQLTRNDGYDHVQRNCRAKRYTVQLEANRNYTIDMISGDPLGIFDPVLRLEHNGIMVAEDDDSGDGEWDARIFFRPQQTGQYTIVCTTFVPQQTGSYRLVVRVQ